MTAIDEIKERLDIVEVIGGYVPLQKAGRNYKAPCPFHQERTPSFVVFPETQRWRCFGACNEGGDLFTFVMKREGWDFTEALARLAERAGVELVPRSPARAAEDEVHERLRAALVAASAFYQHLLLHAPVAAAARAYTIKRGLTPEIIERFQIGFAPESWDTLRAHLLGRGFTADELFTAGLLTRNAESGTLYDRFRNRLLLPIRDGQGVIIGFGGRALGEEQTPKYLNSPQSPLFDKSHVLFGLDLARKAIREGGIAVIVEGYLDAVAAHQAGFTNVVAQLGTALTEAQLKSLKRYARRIVLALDSDSAGARATLRGLQVARETLDRADEAVFDPHGLLRFEGRLQADIRVLTLPDGQDPDDVIRADPADWARRVTQAQPVVEYVLAVLTAGRDVDDPKVKAEIAAQLMPLIQDVANPIERDGYVQKVARFLRVDESAVRAQAAQAPTQSAPTRGSAPATSSGPRPRAAPTHGPRRVRADADPQEAYCLSLLIHAPYLLAAADQLLVGAGLDLLSADDFEHPEHRQIFRIIRQYDITTPIDWDTAVPEILHERLAALRRANVPTDDEKLRGGLLDAVALVREKQLRTRGLQLQFLVQEAHAQQTTEDVEQYKSALLENARAVDRVQRLKAQRARYTGQEKAKRRPNY